jgi:hypothetical protein
MLLYKRKIPASRTSLVLINVNIRSVTNSVTAGKNIPKQKPPLLYDKIEKHKKRGAL